MFLAKLNQEQKEMFLELSIYAARSNNVLSDVEKEFISQYCLEMGIEKSGFETKTNLEELLEKIKEKSSETELNMIFFEILGLILSDKVFDDMEKDFMDKLLSKFEISDEFLKKSIELINSLSKLYVEVNNLIDKRGN